MCRINKFAVSSEAGSGQKNNTASEIPMWAENNKSMLS